MSSTDHSACDCRRITIRNIYVGAAIGCFVALGLFIAAAFREYDPDWILTAGLVQGASVTTLGIAARLQGWRWWYATFGGGVLSIFIWVFTYLF